MAGDIIDLFNWRPPDKRKPARGGAGFLKNGLDSSTDTKFTASHYPAQVSAGELHGWRVRRWPAPDLYFALLSSAIAEVASAGGRP